MSLTKTTSAVRTATIFALTVFSVNGLAASAGSKNRTSNIQMASIQGAGVPTSDSDFFLYPDEPIPTNFPIAHTPKPISTAAFHNVAGYDLPFVAPTDYSKYVKVGKSYKIKGKTYHPSEDISYDETGMGSWYGPNFHGKLTANGETYNMYEFTAAHPTLPLPCFVEVTNVRTGEALVVRVNDRGPFAKDRIIDLSHAAASKLSVIEPGSAELRVKYLAPAPRAEDLKYAPTLEPAVTQIAAQAPKARTAQTVKASLPTHFVQMGSFTNRKNAENFSDQLLESGADSNVVFAHVNGSKYYRVVMGPFNSKSDADNQKHQMARRGFDGLVIRNPS